MAEKIPFETDDTAFPADAYRVRRWRGIAWWVMGWELDVDEATGASRRSGNVVAVMVGDDQPYTFSPDDLTPVSRFEYCGECGQIGCGHGKAAALTH